MCGKGRDMLWDFGTLKARILNMTNRNTASATAGCCDRVYWGWKLKDFPDLSKQYALYPFSILMDGSNPREVALLLAQASFWARALRRDGSADQAFPSEKSCGPTLYSANAVLSAFPALEKYASEGTMADIRDGIARALDFSVKTPELYGHIANHKALFAHTYLLGYRLTGEKRCRDAYREEIRAIMERYEDGYFLEYETADPGYQTQCLHYLTLCYELDRDEGVRKAVVESLERFSRYFLFPDGSYSGIIAGRGTEILYPYAFFRWRDEVPACGQVCSYLFGEGCGDGLIAWPYLDFENMIRLGTNYLLCRDMPKTAGDSRELLPCFCDTKRDWPGAGLAVRGDSHKYMMLNLKRGGVFKLVAHGNGRRIEDGGYLLESGGTRLTSSLYLDRTECFVSDDGTAWTIEKPFGAYLENYLTVPKNIVLRLLALTLFRSGRLAMLVKRQMVRMLILNKKKSGFMLRRTIEDKGSEIVVVDTISGHVKSGTELVLLLPVDMLPFHMASAGYYGEGHARNERDYAIDCMRIERLPMTITTKIIIQNGNIKVHRRYD